VKLRAFAGPNTPWQPTETPVHQPRRRKEGPARRSGEMTRARVAAGRNTRNAAEHIDNQGKGDEPMRAELEQPIEALGERIDEMRAYL